jgi:hypothetical protein
LCLLGGGDKAEQEDKEAAATATTAVTASYDGPSITSISSVGHLFLTYLDIHGSFSVFISRSIQGSITNYDNVDAHHKQEDFYEYQLVLE